MEFIPDLEDSISSERVDVKDIQGIVTKTKLKRPDKWLAGGTSVLVIVHSKMIRREGEEDRRWENGGREI